MHINFTINLYIIIRCQFAYLKKDDMKEHQGFSGYYCNLWK
jgi:hypothetical protein